MFDTIMVPLDGSAAAESALPFARALARSAHGKLVLVTVPPSEAALVGLGPIEELDSAGRARRKGYLSDVRGRLASDLPDRVSTEVLDGEVVSALLGVIDRRAPALVVLATHGQGGDQRQWLGSVAEELLCRAAVPLLVVRPSSSSTEAGPDPDFRGGIVALDLSLPAELVLGPVRDLALATQSHVTLVHALDPVAPLPRDGRARLRGEAQRYLDRVADRLRDEGLRVATRVLDQGTPAGSILSLLEGGRADWVALTPHGAGGATNLMLGSVADKVVRGTVKPVLLYRPAAPAPGQFRTTAL